jgi:hypothetical protein
LIKYGIIIYNKLTNIKNGYLHFIFLTIQNIKFFELFIIIFTFLICLSFLSKLLYLNLEYLIINNTNIIYNWAGNFTNTVNVIDTTNTVNIVNAKNAINSMTYSIIKIVASTVENSAMMAAGLSVGAKIGQLCPILAGKATGVALGLTTETGGIILKNIAESVNIDIKKNFFLPLIYLKILILLVIMLLIY